MLDDTSRAATKDRPGCLVSNPEPYTRKELQRQSDTVPEVLVYRRGGSVFVALSPRPWGWPCMDREFFNAAAAERYAARLKGKIAGAAKKEAARRERQWLALIEEAEARLERAGYGD